MLDLNTGKIATSKPDRIEVGLVPVDSIEVLGEEERGNLQGEAANAAAFKDAAVVKFALRGDRLFNPNPSVSMKIEAGQIADNQRLELFAYVVDVAGNVGGTETLPAAANWRTLHGTGGVLATLGDENPVTAADSTDAASSG